MPKISVIMGVYNCQNYDLLLKSVQSVIEQTYSDWEFLICDDGSTDDTLEKLYRIEEMDSRIKILTSQSNMGLANALNICIKEARGHYIARQDDDDISLPERFEKQIEFLDLNPQYSIVGSIASVFNEKGIWGEYKVEECPTVNSFFWNSPFAHPTVMMKKKDLEHSGCYRVSRETRRCEDYDLFMRMYASGFQGYNIQEKLYLYRIINGNKKYRAMKYRVDEAIVRYKGYKNLGILIKGIPYIFKPIIIGLIPQFLFKKIREKQY